MGVRQHSRSLVPWKLSGKGSWFVSVFGAYTFWYGIQPPKLFIMKLSTMLVPLLTALTVSARIYNPTVPLNFTIGNDGPQAAATLGYSSQHTALFVSNFDKSVAFYRDILGMRTVFEIKWDTYKISYLTYSGGGGDEAVHETGAQLFGKQTKLKGGFELQWYKVRAPMPGSSV